MWQWHSVWEWDERKGEGVVLQEGYFGVHPGSKERVSGVDDIFFGEWLMSG